MVSKRDERYYAAQERKRQRMRQLAIDQENGTVADGDAVRVSLIERMNAGEMTLLQVQAELKRIQAEARKAGRPVRADYFKR